MISWLGYRLRYPGSYRQYICIFSAGVYGGGGLLNAIVTDFELICKHFPSRTEEDDEKAKSG
jgi:hypothetical protein